MRFIPLAAIAVAVLTTSLWAESPPLRETRAIEAASRTEEELIGVALDSAAYLGSDPRLADVRVLDSQGREVAYIVRMALRDETGVMERLWSARNPEVKTGEAGAVEVTLKLQADDPQPSEARFVTPLEQFEQQVQVFSSDDGVDWTPVAEGLIFDYSPTVTIRKDRLPLPQSSQRWLRFVFGPITAEQRTEVSELSRQLQSAAAAQDVGLPVIEPVPFSVGRIEFSAAADVTVASGPKVVERWPRQWEAKEASPEKATVVTFDTCGEPVATVTVLTDSRNFSRRVRLEAELEHEESLQWSTIADGVLKRFDFRSLQEELLTLKFAERRASRFRLTVENQDSQPLAITGIMLTGPEEEVVFFAEPGENYRLAYGGGVEAPQYDTAAIRAALQVQPRVLLVSLGQEVERIPVTPIADLFELRRWYQDPKLLVLAMLLLVVAIGVGLVRANRRVNELSSDDSPSSPKQ